ncbi:MAG: glucans biosynthesis glucosyltransferase MdoH, partial [Pseudomonadota bacterium]
MGSTWRDLIAMPGEEHKKDDHMSDSAANIPLSPLGGARAEMTPAGLQNARSLTMRRWFVLGLNAISMALLSWGLIRIFGAGGWTAADITIFVCFLIGAPWTVMGFWNAIIGLTLLHGSKDGLSATSPFLEAAEADTPIRTKTAVCMFLRNEDPERAFQRLIETKRSIDATGYGDRYDVFVLSDTNEADWADAEAAAFEKYRALLGPNAIYRRREKNTGFKAGNIRDFLRRWGGGYDFFLPLDSDSLMAGPDVLRLTRVMQAYPRLGILQSL